MYLTNVRNIFSFECAEYIQFPMCGIYSVSNVRNIFQFRMCRIYSVSNVRNIFSFHMNSFFLLTLSSVLNEILLLEINRMNKNNFGEFMFVALLLKYSDRIEMRCMVSACDKFV
jgi:hypothetical protein